MQNRFLFKFDQIDHVEPTVPYLFPSFEFQDLYLWVDCPRLVVLHKVMLLVSEFGNKLERKKIW